MKVLVVDDHKDAAFVTGHMFEMMNHEVHLAYNGAEAIAKAQDIKPDLVFLDLGMPEMDGFEVCRKIREKPALKNIRIIAQTGRGDDETIAECQKAGFNQHLLKPIEISSIQEIIQSMTLCSEH